MFLKLLYNSLTVSKVIWDNDQLSQESLAPPSKAALRVHLCVCVTPIRELQLCICYFSVLCIYIYIHAQMYASAVNKHTGINIKAVFPALAVRNLAVLCIENLKPNLTSETSCSEPNHTVFKGITGTYDWIPFL